MFIALQTGFFVVLLLLASAACDGGIGDVEGNRPDSDTAGDSGDTATDGGDGDGDGDGGGGETDSGGDGDGDSGDTDGTTGDGDGGGDGDGDGDGDGEPDGPAPILPTATAECPTFAEGTVGFTVDGTPREVRIWIDPAAASANSGPIVFYWYGTGGSPAQATFSLGEGLNQLVAAGGVVVAPTHINGGQFPWISNPGADYRLADEVVACAVEQLGNDGRSIHSLGFSAGGLLTTGFAYSRSNYVASVATYSGGGRGTPQNPDNPLAAFILHGGPNDDVFGQDFEKSSTDWRDDLVRRGSFTLLCNHGRGHTIPAGVGRSLAEFFFAHPYRIESPYRQAPPASVPDYCQAQ